MKKILAMIIFAALGTNLMASDLWGNDGIWKNSNNSGSESGTDNGISNDSPIFGSGEWLRSSSRPEEWDVDEDIKENEKDPAIPVGEGLLVLLAGGAIYAASKLKRKE